MILKQNINHDKTNTMKPLTTILIVLALLSATATQVFSHGKMLTNTGSISGVVTHSLTSELVEDAVVQIYAGDEYCYFLTQLLPGGQESNSSNIMCAVLRQYGEITGYVVDSITGEPLEGLTVTLEEGGYTSVTGVDGSFSFEDLEPGAYEVCTGGGCYFYECQTVELEAGETVEVIFNLVPIPIPEIEASITGWDLSIEIDVEIPEYINETLEGFYIYRDGELITEEPVGEMFYIEEHPAGEFTYTATAIFDNSESCPSDEVMVNVEPVLYGEIFHQANGEPIGGAMVTCNGDTTLTDENGEYHLSAGYGTHTCKVEYEGCNTVEEEISFNDHYEWNVGMTEPVMQVEPDELFFEAPCVPGPEPLYISNEGNGPLYWSISVIYEEEEGWLMVPGGSNQVGPGETETLLIYATIEGLENQTYHAQLIIHPYPNVGADTVDVTLDVTIGLNELQGEWINIYPNPTNEKLNIEASKGIERFSLISTIGQKLRDVSMNGTDKKVIDISIYEPGVYILKLFTEDGVIISRQVIIE